MTHAIQIEDLTHHFTPKNIVLNHINIEVPKGSIYGFLGPNGAGKTTTLRLLLGLLQKQTGQIKILGKTFEKNRIEILKQTGSLIEYPSIYGQLTAKQNLLVWQKIYQCAIGRIDEVLDIVGLSETRDKKASNFSLGMKQRLGLGIALLNNPSILVLDEPTNGLDPNGIVEIRELLIKLNSEQKITILISSHLLSEIEKLATHVGLIHKGKMLFQGTLSELLTTQKKASIVMANTSNNELAIQLLQAMYKPVLKNDQIEINANSDEEISKIVHLWVHQNIEVYEIYRSNADLESIFMKYIN
jgi:lantibiotic transport system ATP-binding protein